MPMNTVCRQVPFLEGGEIFWGGTPFDVLYDEALPQRAGISLVKYI